MQSEQSKLGHLCLNLIYIELAVLYGLHSKVSREIFFLFLHKNMLQYSFRYNMYYNEYHNICFVLFFFVQKNKKIINIFWLTHCRLSELPHTIYWRSSISILGTSGYVILKFQMVELHVFANSGDPDQTPHSVASDLGLHCLSTALLRVSRLQLVNEKSPWLKSF